MIIYFDVITGDKITEREIRRRAAPLAPKSKEFWNSDYLAQWGADAAEVVATTPPDVDPPYIVQEGELDKSVPGIWTQTWQVIEPTLADAKAFSLARLNADFDASLQPVEHDGKFWRPGIASASAIRDVVEMTEFSQGTHVMLVDTSDAVHEYALADARLLGVAIGGAYQFGYMERAAKRRAIADAETVAEALAVTWSE